MLRQQRQWRIAVCATACLVLCGIAFFCCILYTALLFRVGSAGLHTSALIGYWQIRALVVICFAVIFALSCLLTGMVYTNPVISSRHRSLLLAFPIVVLGLTLTLTTLIIGVIFGETLFHRSTASPIALISPSGQTLMFVALAMNGWGSFALATFVVSLLYLLPALKRQG